MSLLEEIEHLSQRLLMLPGLIREKQEQNNHKEEIVGLQNTLKDRLLDFTEEAGMELDDAGKKKYTNKEQREARARELIDGDELYKKTATRLKELQDTNARLSVEIDQLRNEFAAYKAVLFALTERLHYESVCKAAANRNSKVEIALCHTN